MNKHSNRAVELSRSAVRGMTPKQIVCELDKYIVGQQQAKRCVAIALRNRMRRRLIESDIRAEIKPKNILMIGATGVGKTEISRRLARLSNCPFVKIEATKFTEVGYVGRDVGSMIRDLVEVAIGIVREEEILRVEDEVENIVANRILDALLPTSSDDSNREQSHANTRNKLRKKLEAGELEERIIDITVEEKSIPQMEIFSQDGAEQMGINVGDMLSGVLPSSHKKRQLHIYDARSVLFDQVLDQVIDIEDVRQQGLELAKEMGIIFLDEIDKICGGKHGGGPDVSRQGVQRDLLPFLEGTTVRTRYGNVTTENILFIAAGAFTMSEPSDLIPELQGRLPIRVELENLTAEDFRRILCEPDDALCKQYQALLAVEGVELWFTEEGIEKISQIAYELNQTTENIGARRLWTVMEKLMEDISFSADTRRDTKISIDCDYVASQLEGIVKDPDISRYIL